MQRPNISLTPFDPALHYLVLQQWLSLPHVTKWWGSPEENRDIGLWLPSSGGQEIICFDGQPVGYTRWQAIRGEELAEAGLHDIPEGSLDVDILIGETAHLGNGIGPTAIKQLLIEFTESKRFPQFIMATSVDNLRAIRAFEKAGFRKFRQFNDPPDGHVCWLMVMDGPHLDPAETR